MGLTREDELDDQFKDAGFWIGILMTIQEIRKHIWSYKEVTTETALLYADVVDNDRRRAIKDKVEKFVRINGEQLNIEEYYFTTKGGYIAWVRTDPRLVSEIHKLAAKSALRDFRTMTFIPKIALDRKARVDALLMAYKKENKDFRYLVRNGEQDIKVLIKRISEEGRCPYRELSLDVLGRLSPLKTQIREKPKEKPDDNQENEDGYTTQGSGRKDDNYVPKEQIFQNITSILNGFSLQQNLQRRF